MIERKIKELSIAFEALSRINDPDAALCISDVAELLKHQIEQAKKENDWTYTPPQRPSVTTDDDIPF
jgi:hypothetical protein